MTQKKKKSSRGSITTQTIFHSLLLAFCWSASSGEINCCESVCQGSFQDKLPCVFSLFCLLYLAKNGDLPPMGYIWGRGWLKVLLYPLSKTGLFILLPPHCCHPRSLNNLCTVSNMKEDLHSLPPPFLPRFLLFLVFVPDISCTDPMRFRADLEKPSGIMKDSPQFSLKVGADGHWMEWGKDPYN